MKNRATSIFYEVRDDKCGLYAVSPENWNKGILPEDCSQSCWIESIVEIDAKTKAFISRARYNEEDE